MSPANVVQESRVLGIPCWNRGGDFWLGPGHQVQIPLGILCQLPPGDTHYAEFKESFHLENNDIVFLYPELFSVCINFKASHLFRLTFPFFFQESRHEEHLILVNNSLRNFTLKAGSFVATLILRPQPSWECLLANERRVI